MLRIYGHFCSTGQVIILLFFLMMSLLITMTSPCTADVTKLFNYLAVVYLLNLNYYIYYRSSPFYSFHQKKKKILPFILPYCSHPFMSFIIKCGKRDATSTTFLQQFYNKSQVVSCYWFKFETNTKITFLP